MSRAGDEFAGPARKRSGWLIPLAVFFVTACLSALVLAYILAPTPQELVEEQPAPTEATRAIAIAIGQAKLHIPANYILLASARRGGALGQVAMAAVLPDLQGYTLGNAQEFTANAPDSRAVNIILRSDHIPLPERERMDRIYLGQAQDKNGRPAPYGLTQFTFGQDSGYRDQDLFTAQTDAGLMVLLCTKANVEVSAPSCLRDMPLPGGLALSYRFKRAQLAQWREIDSGVRALIGAFTDKN